MILNSSKEWGVAHMEMFTRFVCETWTVC